MLPDVSCQRLQLLFQNASAAAAGAAVVSHGPRHRHGTPSSAQRRGAGDLSHEATKRKTLNIAERNKKQKSLTKKYKNSKILLKDIEQYDTICKDHKAESQDSTDVDLHNKNCR